MEMELRFMCSKLRERLRVFASDFEHCDVTPLRAAGKLDILLNYLRRAETAVVVISVRHHFVIVPMYFFIAVAEIAYLFKTTEATKLLIPVSSILFWGSTKDILLDVCLAPRKQYPKWRLFCGMLR